MRFLRPSPSGFDAILNQPQETTWDRLFSSPLTTIARILYDFFPVSLPVAPYSSNGDEAVTVVCISDTHNTQPHLPPGDILVHAGDLTASGTRAELREALKWLKTQPHRHKVVVAGNHDLCLDDNLPGNQGEDGPELDWGDVTYLDRTSVTLEMPISSSPDKPRARQIRVYGSPCTPRHGNWAFQYPRSSPSDPWAGSVPDGTDILVTHAPPKGHMDDPRGHWGCELLLKEVWRVRPRLHVFGHVHCGHGVEAVPFDAVQEAYEDVVFAEAKGVDAGRGGSRGGLRALARVVRAWFGVWGRGGGRGRGETVLVNAAGIGGFRDRLVREAIVVRI